MRQLTVEEINDAIAHRNLKFVSGYTKTSKKALCACGVCMHTWQVLPFSVTKKNGSGCPNCSGNRTPHVEEINDAIAHRRLKFVNGYVNTRKHALCACGVCMYTWRATPDNVTSHDSGCPNCAQSGFKADKPGALYIIKTRFFTGFGITNNWKKRKTQHKRNVQILEEHIIEFDVGQQALDVENWMKDNLPIYDAQVEGFRTEATLLPYEEVVNRVTQYIESIS